jgi:hypothetical protein
MSRRMHYLRSSPGEIGELRLDLLEEPDDLHVRRRLRTLTGH